MSEKLAGVREEDLLLFRYIEKNQTETFFEAIQDRKDLTDIRDQFGNTLLMGFAGSSITGSAEKIEADIKILLGLGSWESVIDTKNRFGKTALMKAASQRRGTPMVIQLLKAGASVDVRGAHHFPAIVYAAWQKVTKNVDVLMEHGKDIYLKDADTKKLWSHILQAAWVNNTKITTGLLTGSVSDWDMRDFLAQEQMAGDAEKNFVAYLHSLEVVQKLNTKKSSRTHNSMSEKTQEPIRAQG